MQPCWVVFTEYRLAVVDPSFINNVNQLQEVWQILRLLIFEKDHFAKGVPGLGYLGSLEKIWKMSVSGLTYEPHECSVVKYLQAPESLLGTEALALVRHVHHRNRSRDRGPFQGHLQIEGRECLLTGSQQECQRPRLLLQYKKIPDQYASQMRFSL